MRLFFEKVNGVLTEKDWIGLVEAVKLRYGEVWFESLGVCNVPEEMNQCEVKIIMQALQRGIDRIYQEPSKLYRSSEHYIQAPNSIELPIYTEKFFTSWQNLAFFSTMLFANDRYSCRYHYFCDLALQYVREKQPIDELHDFQSILFHRPSPVEKDEVITSALLDYVSAGTVIEDICKILCAGNYVAVVLDGYYLTGRRAFHSYHTNLRTLIYGYRKEDECFLALSYHGKKEIFRPHTLSFADVEYAYERNKIEDWSGNEFAAIFNVHHDRMKQGESTVLLQNSLHQYFSSERPHGTHVNYLGVTVETQYGISIYPRLLELLQEHMCGLSVFPYQNIHAFCDHKELLYVALCFARSEMSNYISQSMIADYNQVVSLAHRVKALVQKSILREFGEFERQIPVSVIDEILPVVKQCMEIEYKYRNAIPGV